MRSNLTNHDSYECEYAKYDCGFCNAVVEGKTAFIRHVSDLHGSNIVKFSVKGSAADNGHGTHRPPHFGNTSAGMAARNEYQRRMQGRNENELTLNELFE